MLQIPTATRPPVELPGLLISPTAAAAARMQGGCVIMMSKPPRIACLGQQNPARAEALAVVPSHAPQISPSCARQPTSVATIAKQAMPNAMEPRTCFTGSFGSRLGMLKPIRAPSMATLGCEFVRPPFLTIHVDAGALQDATAQIERQHRDGDRGEGHDDTERHLPRPKCVATDRFEHPSRERGAYEDPKRHGQ